MKGLRNVLTAVLLAGGLVLVLLLTPLGTRPLEALFPVGDSAPVDLSSLERNRKPNQFLVCPIGFCPTTPDMQSPEFDLPAEALARKWRDVVAGQPRVETLGMAAPLRFEHVQRSARFRFPDRVTVWVIPLSESRSTLAIFSRSIYGLNDLGVNRARVESWLAALRATAS